MTLRFRVCVLHRHHASSSRTTHHHCAPAQSHVHTFTRSYRRQACRGHWPQQHRRRSRRQPAAAAQCNCYSLSLSHAEHSGTMQVLHVTRHTSRVTRHTSHVTRHASRVTRHTSHVTRHTSHVALRQADIVVAAIGRPEFVQVLCDMWRVTRDV
jgi:hypothetical protein